MQDNFETVHVHSLDAKSVIEEYRQKGYVLQERTAPTIAAQMGFVRLVFVPAGQALPSKPQTKRRFWLL